MLLLPLQTVVFVPRRVAVVVGPEFYPWPLHFFRRACVQSGHGIVLFVHDDELWYVRLLWRVCIHMWFPCKIRGNISSLFSSVKNYSFQVSGVLCIVIPGVCGIATFSPRLDALGNSVRGVKFCQMLSKRLPVHAFGGPQESVTDEVVALAQMIDYV